MYFHKGQEWKSYLLERIAIQILDSKQMLQNLSKNLILTYFTLQWFVKNQVNFRSKYQIPFDKKWSIGITHGWIDDINMSTAVVGDKSYTFIST